MSPDVNDLLSSKLPPVKLGVPPPVGTKIATNPSPDTVSFATSTKLKETLVPLEISDVPPAVHPEQTN
jgi:hypothetical protein